MRLRSPSLALACTYVRRPAVAGVAGVASAKKTAIATRYAATPRATPPQHLSARTP